MAAKKSKGRICEFDPVIYPTRLWVATNPSYKDVTDTFIFFDVEGNEAELDRDDIENTGETVATTFSVAHRESLWKGVFIAVFRKGDAGVGVITHEAGHATDWLCDKLGIKGFSYDEGEARQYYAQWVANCIDKVLRNRV